MYYQILIVQKPIKFAVNSKKANEITEDIHIVMCCWKRFEHLELQIKNLNTQTYNKRIHLHLLNNNQKDKEKITEIVNKCKDLYDIKISLSHYDNKYSVFQRFIYIKDVLLKKIF